MHWFILMMTAALSGLFRNAAAVPGHEEDKQPGGLRGVVQPTQLPGGHWNMCGKFPISFMCGRSVVNTFSPTHTRVHECIRMYTTTHTFLFPHTHAHTHTHRQTRGETGPNWLSSLQTQLSSVGNWTTTTHIWPSVVRWWGVRDEGWGVPYYVTEAPPLRDLFA